MPELHAVLSASSAHRWLNCTPSAQLERQFPDTTSEAAAEGTLAHAIVETKLGRIIRGQRRGKATRTQKADPLYFPAMEDYCDGYVDFVEELFAEARRRSPDAILCSEMRVDFSRWVPFGFGTTDTTIIADDTMTVVDFKFGKGHAVSAENNPQLRLYALGALEEFGALYDIKRIRTYIVQPRMDIISSEELTDGFLLDWADAYVRPRAERAAKGEGETEAGDHCLFCRAKPACRAYAERMRETLKYEFRDGPLLDEGEIADILGYAERLASWAREVKEYALREAQAGKVFPGYKLVQGRSNRKISDETEAVKRLTKAGYDPAQFMRLRGLTDLSDLMGRELFDKVLDGLVVKPEGKPTLVPNTDKREPINLTDMFKEDTSNG